MICENISLEWLDTDLFLSLCDDFRQIGFNQQNLDFVKEVYMEDSKYNPIEYDNYTLFEFILQTVKF